jgi:hypothetical protein
MGLQLEWTRVPATLLQLQRQLHRGPGPAVMERKFVRSLDRVNIDACTPDRLTPCPSQHALGSDFILGEALVWDKIPVNLHQLLKYSVGFLWVAKSVVFMFGEVVWTTRNKMLIEKEN